MKRFGTIIIASLVALSLTSCLVSRRGKTDLYTDGYLTDNCYQALVKFRPDSGTNGLVARRKSALANKRKASVYDSAMDTIADYCIENKLTSLQIKKYKSNLDYDRLRMDVKNTIKKYLRRGRVAFSYYDEQEAFVVGYIICKNGLKKNMESIIDSMELKLKK